MVGGHLTPDLVIPQIQKLNNVCVTLKLFGQIKAKKLQARKNVGAPGVSPHPVFSGWV